MAPIDQLPSDLGSLFREVLSDSPDLLERFSGDDDPTLQDRERVLAILADQLVWVRPEWEPTARTVNVEALIDAVVKLWPIERLPESASE